jgi:hypothetical protein
MALWRFDAPAFDEAASLTLLHIPVMMAEAA